MAKPSTSDVNGRNSDDLQNSYIFEPALLRELQAQALNFSQSWLIYCSRMKQNFLRYSVPIPINP
ncbi:hypothetical protein, partial [Oleiphilus sp. HI0080]|uniref:hypothetical protein n=1 Tax=Oleiphilus sp. HI0080 TaxID=1822255 RepID=UPI001E63C3E1